MTVMSSAKNGFLVVALLLTVFLCTAAAIQDYFYGDLFLAREIQDVRVGWWDNTMKAVTAIGRGLPMAILALALFGWFLWRKRRAECMVIGGALLSLGVNPLLKILVDRPRPTEELLNIWGDPVGLGFPSGHAYIAIILFGLIYYLTPSVVPWRWIAHSLRLSALMLIVLIGISRVYLGAHWPSDVLGGFLVGGIVLTLLGELHRQYNSGVNAPAFH